MIRAALPILRAQRRGHFVNISAAAVIANYAGFSIYGATKWALEGLSESLAAEVRPLGLKVTIVQPGPFRTEFISRSLERASAAIPDYEASSGKFRRFLETMNGRQPGDPAKAADAIIAAVESDNPPLRLVLGKYAIDKTRRKLGSAARELDAGALRARRLISPWKAKRRRRDERGKVGALARARARGSARRGVVGARWV